MMNVQYKNVIQSNSKHLFEMEIDAIYNSEITIWQNICLKQCHMKQMFVVHNFLFWRKRKFLKQLQWQNLTFCKDKTYEL